MLIRSGTEENTVCLRSNCGIDLIVLRYDDRGCFRISFTCNKTYAGRSIVCELHLAAVCIDLCDKILICCVLKKVYVDTLICTHLDVLCVPLVITIVCFTEDIILIIFDRAEYTLLVNGIHDILKVTVSVIILPYECVTAVDTYICIHVSKALKDILNTVIDVFVIPVIETFLGSNIVYVYIIYEETVYTLIKDRRCKIIKDKLLPLVLGYVDPSFLRPIVVISKCKIFILVIVRTEILNRTNIEVTENSMSAFLELSNLILCKILSIDNDSVVVLHVVDVFRRSSKEYTVIMRDVYIRCYRCEWRKTKYSYQSTCDCTFHFYITPFFFRRQQAYCSNILHKASFLDFVII